MRPIGLWMAFLALVIAACAAALAAPPAATKPLTIVIVGDSTVANYPENLPDRGWGQFIDDFFDPGVTVVNLAKNGRSSKTFIKEGLWTKALAEKPNYILIQFGHNDSHAATQPESTNAATDYRDYLRQYVDDARHIGAVPILITPMQRRTYDASGKLDNSLLPYADAMKAVAREKGVDLIDLNAMSGDLYQRLGKDANKIVSRNGLDTTHFNAKGARWMADLVIGQLLKDQPELKARLKKGAEIPKAEQVGADK
ncbi:MAG TPA: rhamnogalacturonan acetylesterase [Phycisphaerae bacterium]|nr:rhamnogalacturonan acetylesterase [Phycisphaerae bacterium]